jgi:PKD repeat protein
VISPIPPAVGDLAARQRAPRRRHSAGRRRLALFAATLLVVGGSAVAPTASASAALTNALANPLAARPFDSGAFSDGSDYSAYGEYGEVNEFGGFDTAAYDSAGYDQADLTLGKFLSPVGFTVDPDDDAVSTESGGADTDTNAIWVLDRTSKAAYTSGTTSATEATYRVQELDDQGSVLGSTTFLLQQPSSAPSDDFNLIGLAVDQSTGLVYSLVDEYTGTAWVPYEVVAWSSTPNGSQQIVAPSGTSLSTDTTLFATDPSSDLSFAAPVVVSAPAQITDGETASGQDLYNPQGLAVDDQSGQDAIAVEASGSSQNFTTSGAAGGGGVGVSGSGPTVVQQIATSGSIGDFVDYWSSTTGAYSATGTALEASEDALTAADGDASASSDETQLGPAGISTNVHTGDLTVLLDDGSNSAGDEGNGGEAQNVDVIDLNANLETEQTLASAANNAGNAPLAYGPDGQAIATEGWDPPYPVDQATFARNAGPAVVGLSNGLYAANYEGDDNAGADAQSYYGTGNSNNNHGLPLWLTPNDKNAGAEGVRLLDPETDGALSAATEPLSSVYDTLGNHTPGDACSLAYSEESYAAGAGGTVFVLESVDDPTRYNSSSRPLAIQGKEIVEFGPITGADALTPDNSDPTAGACPTPTGTFGVSNATTGGAEQSASTTTSLTVSTGTSVEFDGGAVDYPYTALDDASAPSAAPFAYEWYPEGTAADPLSGPEITDAMTSVNGSLVWPVPTQSYQYTQVGDYEATLELLGDYGTYVEQGMVDVQAGGPPTAMLAQSSVNATVGQPVMFDGSGSTPYSGASISNYHWDFDDGATDDTGTTPTDSHTYGQAGIYKVQLTVRDDDQQSSSPATETVTVSAASSPGGTTTTSTTPVTTGSPVKFTPSNDVLKPGVTSAVLVLQLKSVKVGTRLTVRMSEPKVRVAKAASAMVGAGHVLRFSTGKLPVGVTTIRFYETVGKGKKAKLKLVKTETIHVSKKK